LKILLFLFESKSFSIIILLLFFVLIIDETLLQKGIFVSGHAIPDRYSLAPNTIVENPQSFPSAISISFSERPDPKVSYIHVEDSAGQRVDKDDFRITGQNDREATVSLDTDLVKDGVYSVSWSALSLDDGHIAKGAYVVGVGSLAESTMEPRSTTQQTELFSPILAIIKAPIIIGEVIIFGFAFSHLYIWKDLNRVGIASAIHLLSREKMHAIISASSIVMIVLSTAYILFQAAIITEPNSSYFDYLYVLFFETSNGIVWTIRIICCIVLLISVYFYSKSISNNADIGDVSYKKRTLLLFAMLVASGFFMAVNSSISHSSAVTSWSQIGIIIDFVHSVIVSMWIGGLAFISYVFFPNINNITKTIYQKVRGTYKLQTSVELLILARFSLLATISIGLISITGLFLTWLHISSVDELLTSDYGRTLIVKLSIAIPVILFGGYHQFWINRISKIVRDEKNNGQDTNEKKKKSRLKVPSSLKSTIKIEVILMLFILAAASVLTVTSPSSQDHRSTHADTSDGQILTTMHGNYIQTFEIQGVPISLHISPFTVGFNNFTVNFLGENQDVSKVSNVFIEFKKSDLSLNPLNAQLQKSNGTAYSSFGGYLSQQGSWDLKITVQRSGSYDLIYRLGLTLNDSKSVGVHFTHNNTVSINQETDNIESDFALTFVLLSIMIAVAATVFCINAWKRLAAMRKELNPQK
jgi:copper transport protein